MSHAPVTLTNNSNILQCLHAKLNKGTSGQPCDHRSLTQVLREGSQKPPCAENFPGGHLTFLAAIHCEGKHF